MKLTRSDMLLFDCMICYSGQPLNEWLNKRGARRLIKIRHLIGTELLKLPLSEKDLETMTKQFINKHKITEE